MHFDFVKERDEDISLEVLKSSIDLKEKSFTCTFIMSNGSDSKVGKKYVLHDLLQNILQDGGT